MHTIHGTHCKLSLSIGEPQKTRTMSIRNMARLHLVRSLKHVAPKLIRVWASCFRLSPGWCRGQKYYFVSDKIDNRKTWPHLSGLKILKFNKMIQLVNLSKQLINCKNLSLLLWFDFTKSKKKHLWYYSFNEHTFCYNLSEALDVYGLRLNITSQCNEEGGLWLFVVLGKYKFIFHFGSTCGFSLTKPYLT